MNREVLGTMPTTKPEGMLRAVVFPELARMNSKTGDGRILDQDGRGTRDLPRTIYAQFVNTSGHESAVIAGALHEVTFHDDGLVSGRGWLLDDDNGRAAVRYIAAQALRHNSVDLAEVKARYEFEENDDDLTLRFTNWKIAATTLVGKPAFADARAELIDDDELVASWYADDTPLVVGVESVLHVDVTDPGTEIVADGRLVQPYDAFHQPEPAGHRKLTVDANGWVSGHLGLWDSFHDGIAGRKVRIPRPDDSYASFNKPGVLTERGIVETGPIFLEGGHRRSPDGDYVSAYGGVENSWADVRVVEGRHGPWVSGVVRPGIDESKVYAARASRISGHWIGTRLKAIVSVNAEGFDVPGGGFSIHEFATDTEGQLCELVASFDVADGPTEEVVIPKVTLDTEAMKIALRLALQDEDE